MNPLLSALVAAGLLTQADADAIVRGMDPEAARLYAEQQIQAAFQRGLTAQQARILDVLNTTQGQPTQGQLDLLWHSEDDLLWSSVGNTLIEIAGEQAVTAVMRMTDISVVVNDQTWSLVHQQVIDFTENYYMDADGETFGSIPNLNVYGRTEFGRIFNEWQRGELEAAGYQDGLPQLIRAIQPVFGADRSARIAATETSRLFSQAELLAARSNEHVSSLIWQTSRDEHVCPYCSPRNGLVVGKEENGFRVASDDLDGFPPIHVSCRCAIVSVTDAALAALREEGLVHA